MTYTPTNIVTISTENSFNTTLTSSSTTNGTWEDVSSYSSITIITSCPNALNIYAQFGIDNSSVTRSIQLSLIGNDSTWSGIHSLTVVAKYFRISLENSTSSNVVQIQTIYSTNPKISVPTSRLSQNINNYSDVINTKAVLAGNTNSGYFPLINASSEGHLETEIHGPVSAFGDISTVEMQPVAQIDFVYGINTVLALPTTVSVSGAFNSAQTYVTGFYDSGNIAATQNGLLQVSAGIGCTSQLTSLRYLNYRPGQGALARFTAIFNTSTGGTSQYAGIGTSSHNNGLFFGYTGTTFGICRIRAGVENWIPQSDWNVDKFNGSNGSDNQSGVTLIPTNGNVYQIKYQYLGFGCMFFYIENNDGEFELCHIIKFTNANKSTNIAQPSLNLMWRVSNFSPTGSGGPVLLQAGSGSLFLEGIKNFLGPRYSVQFNKTFTTPASGNSFFITGTNGLPLMYVQDVNTLNGVTNRAQIKIRQIAFSLGVAQANNATAYGNAILSIWKNPTSYTVGPTYSTGVSSSSSTAGGGTITYTGSGSSIVSTITNSNSCLIYDTIAGGTTTLTNTTTGGINIYNTIIPVNFNINIDLTPMDIYINPGDQLSFNVNANIYNTTNSSTLLMGLTLVYNDDL